MIRAAISAAECWLFHLPQSGWCVWDAQRNTHAHCKCAVCGREYLVRGGSK